MLKRLTLAIGQIGPEFEQFGGCFLDHLLHTRLEHSGLNDFGYPVSRVVDSISDDNKVVAQYGAHTGYFSGDFAKASEDIDQALALHPGAEIIFLFADEVGPPIRIAKFRRRILAESRMQGKGLRVWGANRIAGWILRHLLTNDSAVDELAAFLPELAQIRDEFARDQLFIDPTHRHRPRPALIAEIKARLQASPCLIISGIGGAGKSEAAAAFGQEASGSYQMKIWLHREEFRGVQDLQALPLVRGGEKRNVANLLKTKATLLVIDDPEPDFQAEALVALCGTGSHVIVTVRKRMAGDYPLPALLQSEAHAMLEASPAGPCPDAIFDKIWQTVGGHPLTLSTMNASVALDGASWFDIENDCDAVGELDDREQRLADRLLGRYRDLLFSELSVFEWLKRADVDGNLLRKLVRPVGIRKLAARALTAADRPTSVRLHDLVFAALPSLRWWTEERRAELDDLLERYCRDVWDSNDVRLWSAANSAQKRLLSIIAEGDRRPALLLAALTILDFHQSPPIDLGDPIADAAHWAAAGLALDPLEVRLAIERFEWIYLNVKERDQGASEWATRGLPLFDHLAQLPGLTPRQVAEIRHHRGKALSRAGRPADARAEFEAVLASGHPLEATRLQLLRAYKAEGDFDKAIEFGDAVIASAERGDDISATVLLGVLESMPWRDQAARVRVLRPRERFIVRTIVEHGLLGYNQAYQALAAVARYWSTEAPAVLKEVLEDIPLPDLSQFETDRGRSEMADILLEAGRSQQSPDREASFARALSFFDSVKSLTPFYAQRRAELLTLMGRAEDARAVLCDRPDLEKNGYVQRLLANALLSLGQATAARGWIDRALGDPNCEKHYHEFRKLRFEIRKAEGDDDAAEDLRLACDLAADGPIKEEWCALLLREEASLSPP